MDNVVARLRPGVSLPAARDELNVIARRLAAAYPDTNTGFGVAVTPLEEAVAGPLRPRLLVLLGAVALVLLAACANVANLLLVRASTRAREVAVRAALGASTGALRRTLLAESVVLCGAGALLGIVLARPLVAVLARYASRFSVRALDVTVDASLLWVGAGLAIAAAVLLAFVPRLPSAHAQSGFGLASGSVRITPGTNRRLRAFAVTQIALSFILLAGAGMLLATLVALQTTRTGYDMRQVLAIDVPPVGGGRTPAQVADYYDDMMRRIRALPGVENVALGSQVPWRDAGSLGPGFQFAVEGITPANGEENPRGRFRSVTPGFFQSLGVPLLAGRDFTADDRAGSEKVVIVSQSVANRLFPGGDALNRHLTWTDPIMQFINVSPEPRRIVGIVADVDDENVVPGPALTVYHPTRQEFGGSRLFIHASGDPYALVAPATRIIRELYADQPVEHAATLEDVRAEVLAPQRLNAFVFSGFAGVALLIAVVGVAGVLAFSVSARTREFGVRLAIGSTPRHLLARILGEGALIAAVGIAAGAAGGYVFAKVAASYFTNVQLPGAVPLAAAAGVLIGAAVVASLMPAARAARVDVMQALRAE
jgi:predicted permease